MQKSGKRGVKLSDIRTFRFICLAFAGFAFLIGYFGVIGYINPDPSWAHYVGAISNDSLASKELFYKALFRTTYVLQGIGGIVIGIGALATAMRAKESLDWIERWTAALDSDFLTDT